MYIRNEQHVAQFSVIYRLVHDLLQEYLHDSILMAKLKFKVWTNAYPR